MHHPNEAIAEKYKDTVRRTTAGQLVWTGRINFDEEALLAPLKRKLPTTWFVNSLSDLFHEDLAFEIVDRIIAVMDMTPQRTEERRVGKECGSTSRDRWSPDH